MIKIDYCVGWNFDGPIYVSHYLVGEKAEYYTKLKEYNDDPNNYLKYIYNKTLCGRGK